MDNPYSVLGVNASASDADIAAAYKKLAKQYHPDLHPNDSRAAEKMGQINQAYDEIKAQRQSGNRTNSAPRPNTGRQSAGYRPQGGSAYSAYSDPFGFYRQNYGQQQAGNAYSYTYTTRTVRHSPLRLIAVVAFTILIFRLVLTFMFATPASQTWLYGSSGQNAVQAEDNFNFGGGSSMEPGVRTFYYGFP